MRRGIVLILFLGGCSLVSDFPAARQRPAPTTETPLVAYDFEELEGGMFADVGRFGAYPLTPEGTVEVADGGVVLDEPDYLVSPPVTGFNVGVTESKSFAIELWLATANTTQGDTADPGFNARILNVSEDAHLRNVTIAQWLDGLIIRVRRGDGEGAVLENGTPAFRVLGIFEDTEPHHHLLQVSGRELEYWVDGEPVVEETMEAELTGWDEDYVLTLGDELIEERPWAGTVYDLRLYDAPFDPEAIRAAASAGPPE